MLRVENLSFSYDKIQAIRNVSFEPVSYTHLVCFRKEEDTIMKKNHLRMLALAMAAMMSLTACGGGSATEASGTAAGTTAGTCLN